jgi:hypothetical protein
MKCLFHYARQLFLTATLYDVALEVSSTNEQHLKAHDRCVKQMIPSLELGAFMLV